jgi:hypothetical protein
VESMQGAIFLGSLVLFVGLWFFVVHMIARFSGWRALGELYSTNDPFRGELFRFSSGTMQRGASYSACLNVGSSVRGLSLGLLFLFRPGHPSLFIPWDEIRIESKPTRWIATVTYQFVRRPGISLTVTRRLAEKVARARGVRLDEVGSSE